MVDRMQSFGKDYFDSGINKIGQYGFYEERRFYPAFDAMSRKIKALLNPKKVLDLGCAKGFLVDCLFRNNIVAQGTDISEYAIATSPASIRAYLQVVDLNTQSLPFEDAAFDVVICMGTLEYLYNQPNALREINRVLKSNGIVLITTLNYVPENDTLRIFAKKEQEWNQAFNELGFINSHQEAKSIFPIYVKHIALFDLQQIFFAKNPNLSLKVKIAKFIYHFIPDPLISQILLFKQLKYGYLMLGYRKKSKNTNKMLNE